MNTPYDTESCLYIKYISVPKDYNIIVSNSNSTNYRVTGKLPPMNMGYILGTTSRGYIVKPISYNGTYDDYAIITSTEEVLRNSKTRRKLNPKVYIPQIVNPSTFEFKYKIVKLDWN